ncbi:MAG: lamin tail domain-containing protein [bacterium]|nr:lamin tail domain-containing protein [bacterium]
MNRLFLFLICGLMITIHSTAFSQAAIINEWSQGPAGNQEWVEILVIQDGLNMQNWTLRDGNNSGLITFSGTIWQNIPAGAIIVIYNATEKDPNIPADDLTFGTDKRVIMPHNSSGNLTSSAWIAFANATATDNPTLRNASNVVIHDWDQNDNSAFTAGTLRPAANQSVNYTSNTAAGVATASNWTRVAAASATPGSGNGGVNSQWISILRGENTPPTITSISRPVQNPSPNTNFAIQAEITGVQPGMTAFVYYSVNGGSFQNVPMSLVSGNTYQGYIPGQANGALIAYHVEANNLGSPTSRFPSSGEHYVRIYGTILTDASIIINEFRYSSDPDWVEIYNKTNSPIDLSYWKLWDNQTRSYDINPGTILPANGYLVFTQFISTFNSTYPNFTGTLYNVNMPFGLNFDTDQIRLFDVNGNLVDGLTYTNTSPWPNSPSGTSIELISPNSDNSLGANWKVSAVSGGTPGGLNSTQFYTSTQTSNNPNPPQSSWNPSFPNDPFTANQPPVVISFPAQSGSNSNPTSVTVSYSNTRPPLTSELDLPTSNTIQRFWSIEATGGNFQNATLTLNFTASDLPSGIPDPVTANPPIMAGYTTNNGATWHQLPLTNIVNNGSYYSATITGLSHFSDWGLGNGGELPVELSSFHAVAGIDYVNLYWQTESEVNNKEFRIYRSLTHNELGELIAIVSGQGNSITAHQYRYVDRNVQGGVTYYYRLMDVSFDGSTTLHPQIVTATPLTPVTVPYEYDLQQNYPNPFNPTTTIDYSIQEEGVVTLTVFDVSGREVAQLVNVKQVAGRYSVTFDASHLPAGIYVYQLRTEGVVKNRKMLLLK